MRVLYSLFMNKTLFHADVFSGAKGLTYGLNPYLCASN